MSDMVDQAASKVRKAHSIISEGEIIAHAVAKDQEEYEFGHVVLWRLCDITLTGWAVLTIDENRNIQYLHSTTAPKSDTRAEGDFYSEYILAVRSLAHSAVEEKAVLSWEFPVGDPIPTL